MTDRKRQSIMTHTAPPDQASAEEKKALRTQIADLQAAVLQATNLAGQAEAALEAGRELDAKRIIRQIKLL